MSSSPNASLVIATAMLLVGCEQGDGTDLPLDVQRAFGSPGSSMGQFAYPRAIDVDAKHGFVYVVDKLARVQRFGLDGHAQLQWRMPEMANGKPTGVSVAPDGRIFVPDTHYFRVIVYDSEGNELLRFGEYGQGPGQFIYVTDVAFGPQDRIYVSEYGGNDRIQVFDAMGKYLFELGGYGLQLGQFRRPQSMVFNPQKTELFVTDACNHRIQVFDPSGKFLRAFGTAGHEPGQLMYPYGMTMLADGTLMIAEFGNNRVQRMDQHGASLGVFGRVGRGAGELQYPWAVAATDEEVFVLDSGNNRVQVIRTPS